MLNAKEVRLGTMMDKRLQKVFEGVWASLFKATTGFAILLAFLVVIPFTLWFAWAQHTTLVNPILVTLFCLSFAWVFVSMVLCYRRLRKLGLDGEGRMRLFSGPRPSDPDELRAWQLGWHFMYAVLAALLCMISIPLVSWLSGR
ncbi:MAG: hypothetical protein DMG31_16875 [Acidobacteria bacterium]|nr:MAG: hypothetical protein DMG31_16875 [Acidobacteriota bacterium]